MSVGGKLIEARGVTILETGQQLIRLWVIDDDDTELCVYVEPRGQMPDLGDEVWWQAGKVYFNGDRQTLTKVGYSFAAPRGGP